MVDFGGWAMPVDYKSMLGEARAVRTTCGLFDASHMGEIRVKGSQSLEFLQKILTNDLARLMPGQLQYNLMLEESGGALDDLMVYRDKDSFLCVVNASNTEKDLAWLKAHRLSGVELIDESPDTALLSVQGPCSCRLLEAALGTKLDDMAYMRFVEFKFEKTSLMVSRSGYTGEDGFEIYLEACGAGRLWDALSDKGKEYGLTFCGLASRDILRVEAGYPLYGHELDQTINPLEAGLAWAVKYNKDFIGKDVLCAGTPARQRVGLVLEEKGVPRQGQEVYCRDKLAGLVTSGVYSPNLDRFIAMAYAGRGRLDYGDAIQVKIRDRFCPAKVVSFAFIESRTKRKPASVPSKNVCR